MSLDLDLIRLRLTIASDAPVPVSVANSLSDVPDLIAEVQTLRDRLTHVDAEKAALVGEVAMLRADNDALVAHINRLAADRHPGNGTSPAGTARVYLRHPPDNPEPGGVHAHAYP